MIYDGSNPIDQRRARDRLNKLIESSCVFELTEKTKRSYSQNNYLHMIISYLACETGETHDYVKDVYYKYASNKDIYVLESEDKRIGIVRRLKSSSELTKDEMSLSIERFRNFASVECGIYLPAPNEEEFLKSIMLELNRNKIYL